MTDLEEITNLSYTVRNREIIFDEDGPNLRFTGRYRGEKVYNLAWVSDELLADVPALESFMKRSLLTWARENWPPPGVVDNPA